MPACLAQRTLGKLRFWAAIALTVALSVAVTAEPAAASLDEQAAAWAAEDARVLERTAPRLADSVVSSTFVAMESRVGAYADWVYGWLSSLLTAWDLAYVGSVEAGSEIAAGRFPDSGTMHDRLTNLVQQRFEAVVIRPEQTNAALVDGWQRTMLRLAAFDRQLAADRRRRIERLAADQGVDPRPAVERHGLPLLSASIVETAPPTDLAYRALGEVEAGAGGTADRVLVRSLRPLVTRAISVTTRLLLAPLAGGVLASPLASANGLATAAATLAAVSAGIWGVDYAINRVDSALTRSAFENDLGALVRDARAEASRIARRHARTVTCDALAANARAAGSAC